MQKNFYELTSPQKSIWFTENFYKGTSIENITGTVIVPEKVDFSLLDKSINIFVEKNDNFRLNFVLENGEAKQFVQEYSKFTVDIIDINSDNELKEVEKKIATTAFDVLNSYLYIFKMIRFPDGHGGFIVNMHHLISDAWSAGFGASEIIKIYTRLLKNESLDDISYPSYVDFISREQEYNKSKKFAIDKEFWNACFNTVPEIATIPSTYNDSRDLLGKACRKQFTIPKSLIVKINEYCKTTKVSAYNFFMAIFSIYIGKVCGLDEFVVGTPILNRSNVKEKNTSGMFVNTIPLKIELKDDIEFKEFATNIGTSLFSIFKHQKYPYLSLLEDLRHKDSTIPNLYNILISYQNIRSTAQVSETPFEITWVPAPYTSDDIDIHIYDMNDTGNINIAYDYQVSKYSMQDILDIHERILGLINQVLNNSSIVINNFELVTESEKEKLLNDFNDTKATYDKSKTISMLFEEQAKKTPDRVALVFGNKEMTYKELDKKSNSIANFLRTKGVTRNDIIGIMVNRSLEMIISILGVLKSGATYIPIDPEYPQDRVEYMLNNSSAKFLLTFNTLKDKVNFENKIFVELDSADIYKTSSAHLENINKPEDSSYIIYTSGSTGLPKGVVLNHKALSNLTNYCNHYVTYLQEDIYRTIVSVTTVSFDIFVFETLISLQHGLKLVIANEDEQNIPRLLNNLMLKNNVSIIQTTPSRMQIFVNNLQSIPALKNLDFITLAGEQLPITLANKLKAISGATIYNGYGPSETTVFSTLTDVTNHNPITIGKPLYNTYIYILDSNLHLVPIGTPGEIYIAGDGVGKGYFNRPDLTEKGFIPNPFIPNAIMYKTGDLGCFRNDGEILCLGRVDNQVKIRGLRIELEEIEHKILDDKSITNCVVAKKVDRNSHELLCAYYTASTNIDINKLRTRISTTLPNYMVPQYFIELKEFPYTPNGKVNRKLLPMPKLDKVAHKIVSPRNDTDSKLVDILKDLINLKDISMTDSFFDLGGDSLTAINLCARVYDTFSVQISVKDIFEHPVISELSDIITDKTKNSSVFKLEEAPKLSAYPVSCAQRRIYYASIIAGETSVIYNMPGGLLLDSVPDVNILEHCLQTLINRHESFRTYFDFDNKELVQKIKDKVMFNLEFDNETISENDIKKQFNAFIKPFDLSKAPLIRAKLVKISNSEKYKSLLLLDTHHIICDGTSLQILINELCNLYKFQSLPELNITYKDFAWTENKFLKSPNIKEAEDYWVSQFNDDIPVLEMPTNFSRPATQSFKGNKIYFSADKSLTEKINTLCKSLEVTPYMFTLAAYFVLLHNYAAQDDIVVGSPIVGRDYAETNSLVGMFVNTIPIRMKIDSDCTFADFLNSIKDRCVNNYKYQTYPFDELVNKLNLKRDVSRNPLFDTLFTFQNIVNSKIDLGNIHGKLYSNDSNISKFDLSLEIVPSDGQLSMNFEYCTKLFNRKFIEALSNHYINILKNITENVDIRLDDIDMLSQDEKNILLHEFNNSILDYPKTESIKSLFEEVVNKYPNDIAIVDGLNNMSYQELNEKSNSLAHYLIKSGVQKGDIVPVIMHKSLDLIVSLCAIMKSGAIYLPLSTDYPQDKINYILNDCNAKIALTTTTSNLITNDKVNTILIDTFNFDKYSTQNIDTQISANDILYIIYTADVSADSKGIKISNKNIANLIYSVTNLFGGISCADNCLSSANISFDVSILEFFISLLNGATLYMYDEPNISDVQQYCKTIVKNNITFLYIAPNILDNVYNTLATYTYLPINKILVGVESIGSATIRKYYSLKKDLRIINGYGPTETSICATACVLNDEILNQYRVLPLGKPISNSTIYILDKDERLVPIDVPGEVYIAGDCVGKGYLNNKELTERNFVEIPHLNCKRAYKTGDLAKWNSDGTISFVGKKDYSIQINGHKVELEEIECCIYQYPNIEKVVVLLNNAKKIVAYFSSEKSVTISDLKAFIQRKLPAYLIPDSFVQVEQFKLTSNGKIDRSALSSIRVNSNNKFEDPHTSYQKKLVEIFKSILKLDKVGINDNFFELGGDSLYAIQLQIEAFNQGLEFSYKDIFTYPTVKQLSEKILQTSPEPAPKEEVYDYTKIDELIAKNDGPIKMKKDKIKNILLTGATGYLGSHILDNLLKHTKCNIYCLIRAKNNNDPQTRLLDILRFYFGPKYDKYIFKRIFAVEGDITDKNLGLTDMYYEELGKNISCVINSAAIVKHYGNSDIFNNTNISGTQNIIDFCEKFNCKLMHLSTLSVSGNIFETDHYRVADLSPKTIFSEKNLYIGQDLSNIYIHTKFIAERLILEHILSGKLNATIIRLGNITNRYSDGAFQINVSENAFLNRMHTFLELGCIPDYLLDNYMEFTPVDLCADAVVKLTLYNSPFTIFHVYNNNHITFRELKKILDALNVKMDVVTEKEFNVKIQSLSRNADTKNIISGIINDFGKDKKLQYYTHIQIKNDFTNKFLKNILFKWPKIGQKYINKYIIYLKSIGYIK